MKRTILISLLLFTAAFLFSQNTFTPSLDTVCESLASNPNTTGDFTQTKLLLTNGRKLKSTGKYIICPDGIVWQTEKPVASSLVLTKETMIQITAAGKKSVMNGKDNQIFANISETMSSVFSGDAAALKKNFHCKFEMNKNGEWTALLEPKDATIASVMKSLLLSGTCTNNKDAKMTSLVITEASGNTITDEFTNQKYPEELTKDERQLFIVE